MILSMTGFGKSEFTIDHLNVNVEIRSLNSKFFDLYLKIPSIFKSSEILIRKLLKEELLRGKVELIIHYEKIDNSFQSIINKEKVMDYHDQLKIILDKYGYKSDKDLIGYVLKLPEAIDREKETINKEIEDLLIVAIKESCEELNKFRKEEGMILEIELRKYINVIIENLSEIKKHEKKRLIKVKEKLLKAIDKLQIENKIDEKRLEQELIFYSEKLDITEEKVRLKKHCEHFIETLKEKKSGKKLGFLSQEIGREINTLGSKSNDISIQKIVVNMKDELEKIKEQVLNIL